MCCHFPFWKHIVLGISIKVAVYIYMYYTYSLIAASCESEKPLPVNPHNKATWDKAVHRKTKKSKQEGKRRFWQQSKLYISDVRHSLTDEWVGGSLPSSNHSTLIHLAEV